jgi:membrane-associated phospholipid phosphatase
MHHLPPRCELFAVLVLLWAHAAAFAQGAPGADTAPSSPPPQQQETNAPPQREQAPARDDGRRTVVRLPENLFRATFGVFDVANLDAAFVGAVATGFATLYDPQIADALEDPDSELGTGLESGGSPLWSGAVVGALFVGGRFSGATRFRAASYDWLEAYLVTAGSTELVKEIVTRTRPNGQDDRSFPSGHASNAFALATVAERHYGWKVGVAAYGVAALVGVSRLRQNAHYLSDVLGGATLGYVVGRTVVRVNSLPDRHGKAHVTVSPVLARHARAVRVQVSWR